MEHTPQPALDLPSNPTRRAFILLAIGASFLSAQDGAYAYEDPAGNQASPAEVVASGPQAINMGECTTGRTEPNLLVLGKFCSKNALADSIPTAQADKGQSYAALAVKTIIHGKEQIIFKCAYVREGVLPSFQAPSDVINQCVEFHGPLVTRRFSAFRDINCPLIIGIEGCRDGAPNERLVTERCKDGTLYAHYTSDKPSIYNVRGTGRGGFSDPIAQQGDTSVRWRGDVAVSSADGRGALVRGVHTDWGFVLGSCISKATKKNIGPITEFTPSQMKRIKRNKHENRKYEKLVRDRNRHIVERKHVALR